MDSPVRSIDKLYYWQAHHMSKAAQSLVLMLTNLDYSIFPDKEAARLTTYIHNVINNIEGATKAQTETYPVRRHDGKVVQVTVPEREE